MRKSSSVKLFGTLATLLIIVSSIAGCDDKDTHNDDKLDIATALGSGNMEGYSKADKPVEFTFPDDHFAHEEFRNEWWYFTGNLYDRNGNRFGYQLTFFRIAISPEAAERESAWATNQIYMVHLAVSDIENEEFYYYEKLNRGALGLAGFKDEGFCLNVDNWYISGAQDGSFPWQLYAEKDGVKISLEVDPVKDIVLQGENGLSFKSLDGKSASYYYSITRLATNGFIELGGAKHEVSGISWLDREWSTSTLSQEQIGWDWFALHLDDGTDIIYFQLRYKDGSTYPYNEGMIIDAEGNSKKLKTNDIPLAVNQTWQSPFGGVYPVEWEAEITPLNKTVVIRAVFPEQELDLTTRYWEGAVDIFDKQNPGHIIGTGYMEMTGYTESVS